MATASGQRIDSASRFINASPQRIYQAHIDPKALVSWLPPTGMNAHLDSYDPREGGTYRMVLTYAQRNHPTSGKTSEHADVVRGRFVELVPNQRIVQLVEFDSDDPAFAGEMKMTWTFTPVQAGTNVAVRAENVPTGISPADHEAGFRSTLDNLAVFVEGRARGSAGVRDSPSAPR